MDDAKCDFNSIKVQLRLYYPPCLLLIYPNFNSIKVQLRRGSRLNTAFVARNFNSIKVQLRRLPLDEEVARRSFQFHKGTIKTIVLAWAPRFDVAISIP